MTEEIDPTTPASPRVWNYWLGGKDNYESDRAVGDRVLQTTPQIVDLARTSRAFHVRAVTYLTGECGVEQFLDIGTGLPTANNTHEVAQHVNPAARIVYVDNDPIVLAHARALLTSTPEGETRYLDSDLRDPVALLKGVHNAGILDFNKPIALMLINILGHIEDWEQARRIVAALVDALPAGSYLVISDNTNVIDPESMNEAARIYNENASPRVTLRTPEHFAELFTGLDLVEPGLVSCPHWRPDPSEVGEPRAVDQIGAVGRKH
jgi:hypothetical protein